MSTQMVKCVFSIGFALVILAACAPRAAEACWSESGTCGATSMEFQVACSCSGGTCDIYDQCYDCEGGRLDGGDSTSNTTDENLYTLVSSGCSLVTAKNLGRTPSSYHPRLRAPVNVTTGNIAVSPSPPPCSHQA